MEEKHNVYFGCSSSDTNRSGLQEWKDCIICMKMGRCITTEVAAYKALHILIVCRVQNSLWRNSRVCPLSSWILELGGPSCGTSEMASQLPDAGGTNDR